MANRERHNGDSMGSDRILVRSGQFPARKREWVKLIWRAVIGEQRAYRAEVVFRGRPACIQAACWDRGRSAVETSKMTEKESRNEMHCFLDFHYISNGLGPNINFVISQLSPACGEASPGNDDRHTHHHVSVDATGHTGSRGMLLSGWVGCTGHSLYRLNCRIYMLRRRLRMPRPLIILLSL